ncbi:beta-carboxysome assembly chaperone CcmS [Calothrix sp. NIES-3974]|uniref:beta-carboxysome assembly chaperone CcmS n=1 Tax=Calothrix sp. NIES-3974 TaxID=2005462 RepID=UPI000B5DC8B2|nr:hypothetical protein [Calothrix sp. NIES-3974]BAZ03696.1 hypothetical protein NIES3974_03250 [Calothrix sp. NIES-3974]
MFASNPSPTSDSKWQHQLDRFVKDHQRNLAALAWGLWLENQRNQGTIGIDLKPKPPRFVYCPDEAIQKLNDNVENRLQEILGLIEHYNPEIEVLMIAIGNEQIKLIYFQPDTPPPQCFAEIAKDIDTMLTEIETLLGLLDFGF